MNNRADCYKKIEASRYGESLFKERVVIPFLVNNGYEILRAKGLEKELRNRPDVIASKDKTLCLVEIKMSAGGWHLKTVLGQIVLQMFIYRTYNASYLVVFPKDHEEEFNKELVKFMKSEFGVTILFL